LLNTGYNPAPAQFVKEKMPRCQNPLDLGGTRGLRFTVCKYNGNSIVDF
jgi:hypothetical protein